jgi:YihY family inner membrane protein
VTTATSVPRTRGELEGDEAFETLVRAGRRRLVTDTLTRFRAADGFSHSRALAFQITLTLLPALIAIVGLAAVLDQDDFRRAVQATIDSIAPGAVGDLLTDALEQGSTTASRDHGARALAGGFVAAALAGMGAMAQVERGANRIYGVERDRPFARKYAVALGLALSAGVLGIGAFVLLVGGSAIREAAGWSDGFDAFWAVARWPLGILFVGVSVSILFQWAPRRRQPEPTWLAFGATVAVVLWLAFIGVLKLYVDVADSFGATYGPVAGTIGVLLWAFLTSIALFAGLAFAAQLEAVRAGVERPRVDRDEND